MDLETKKKIAKEYITSMLYGGWDDEMLSVHLMSRFKISAEEFVKVTSWMNKKLEEVFGE